MTCSMVITSQVLIRAAAQATILSGALERLCYAGAKELRKHHAEGWQQVAEKISVLGLAVLGAASGIVCAAVLGTLVAATASLAFHAVKLAISIGILAFAAKIADSYSCLGKTNSMIDSKYPKA